MRAKMLVTWNDRARPMRAMANGGLPAMSSPWRRISPAEGGKRPLTRL